MLVLVGWIIFALFGLAMFGASFAGLTGDGVMIATAVVALAAWGTLSGLMIYAIKLAAGTDTERCARWSNVLLLTLAILSVATTWLLGFGAFASCGPAFLSPFYHWGGVAGSVLAFFAYFAFPHVTSRLGTHSWRPPLITGSIVYGLLGVVWLIVFLVLRGDIDESFYPARSSSPYKLPYPGGDSSWVVQGNASSLNHEGNEAFAWDFRRSCGSPVLAARAGTVRTVIDTNDGRGNNNEISVDHGDGTTARYLHIKNGSAKVTSGANVSQGEPLAEVGSVGNSMTGHIHFVVERGGSSIAVTFSDSDTTDDGGIPRTFGSYESSNR